MIDKETMMTLSDLKQEIIEYLALFKTYELGSICSKLCIPVNSEMDSSKSKRAFLSSGITQLTKDEVLSLVDRIRDMYGYELLPEKKYNYCISNITRRDVTNILISGCSDAEREDQGFEPVSIKWYGLLHPVDFLSRLCNLDDIKPVDDRCNSFRAELARHYGFNGDWSDSFFFEDSRLPYKNSSQGMFFEILCEIFHPEVRDEDGNWKIIQAAIGRLLKEDGFEFYERDSIFGRSVWGIRKIEFQSGLGIISGLKTAEEIIDSDYFRKELQKTIACFTTDSYGAIGRAKELVETAYKWILERLDESYEKKDDMQKLVRQVHKVLRVDLNDNNKEIEGVSKILSSLSNIVIGMAELRNGYGSGHGRDSSFNYLPVRYGKLAVYSANAYIDFILNTYQDKFEKRV